MAGATRYETIETWAEEHRFQAASLAGLLQSKGVQPVRQERDGKTVDTYAEGDIQAAIESLPVADKDGFFRIPK